VTDRFPDHEPQTATFRADLPRRRVPWLIRGRRTRLAIVGAVAGALFTLLGFAWVQMAWLSGLPRIPAVDALWSLNRAPGMTFLDRKGATIAIRGPRHGRRVTLKQLPSYVPRAFLAAEDRRFYQHGAVDWLGVLRAAVADVRAGAPVQGGSSLTQQLAKTLFLAPDRTFKRKVQEAILAGQLGRRLSRDQILELYLNRVFFGSGAYGVDAAAEAYFDKPASALSLQEAALLAALPKEPTRLNPTNDMTGALARSHLILRTMLKEGWVDAARERDAEDNAPQLAPEPPEDEDFGYLLDYAQTEAANLARGRAPDLVVQLSIDSSLQTTAAQVARRVMQSQGRPAGATQAALVTLGPDAGIQALVGGLDHRFSRFNRAVQAVRQPGSAFKPLVYAAALETGVKPTDIRKDAPIRLGPWTPENAGGGYAGPVTVADALARSINTVSVRLAQEAGTRRIAALAQRFGVPELPEKPEMSVALGTYETSLVELTGAYQVFQQGGKRQEPWLISRITTSSGQLLYARPDLPARQVFDPGLNAQMVRMLEGVISHGTGRRAALGRPAAGKTGTSQSYRDAWFIGFTPDLVSGVWVGDDANRPMSHVVGGDLPAEIWRRFMLAAEEPLPVRDFAFAPGAAPPPPPPASEAPAASDTPESRAAFYQGLARDFAEAAR
jgi:penicillin-binding protein 1A